MSKTLKTSLFLLLFFLCVFSGFSQNQKRPLTEVLSLIEAKHSVSFSYADKDVKHISIDISTEKSLDNILDEISLKTNLQFNKIDQQYYTIVKQTESDSFSLQHLEEVIITDYLTSGIYKNNTGNISIKPEQFGILPGLIEADVLQTIQALPGVLSVDETVSNINVRGGTHDQNLFLYDGIKMYQSGHFFGLISAFNPQLTHKISVIKNGTSAKYGDGISSIVDMQLSDKISSDSNIGLGLNLISADGYAKVPLGKKTEIQVAVRRSVTDILDTPTYNNYFDRVFQDTDLTNTEDAAISKDEHFYFYDTALKFLHDLSEKDKIRFNFLNIYNALDYNEEATINTTNEASNSQLKQHNIASGITYERQWNNKLNTFAQIYYSNYDLDATNFDILNNQRLIQENEVVDGGLKLHVNYSLSPILNINGG
ncbi:MAG: TonB-dependent receptor plug domain-containing protein, partial [Flavobacteriaceae bacterium]|nr:TonB-dependent receptor plug domain-containing protein [Flavobacteriaceae bacterium]